jgi:uncharacterized protein YegP (UPF0339 family)
MANPGIVGGLLGQSVYQFTIKKNLKGEFYFVYHNTHGNTEPICWSEGYTTKQHCIDAINTVKTGAASAPIV